MDIPVPTTAIETRSRLDDTTYCTQLLKITLYSGVVAAGASRDRAGVSRNRTVSRPHRHALVRLVLGRSGARVGASAGLAAQRQRSTFRVRIIRDIYGNAPPRSISKRQRVEARCSRHTAIRPVRTARAVQRAVPLPVPQRACARSVPAPSPREAVRTGAKCVLQDEA